MPTLTEKAKVILTIVAIFVFVALLIFTYQQSHGAPVPYPDPSLPRTPGHDQVPPVRELIAMFFTAVIAFLYRRFEIKKIRKDVEQEVKGRLKSDQTTESKSF